jgi:ribosomal protein S18 acetylase RimI-like enzyme
MEPALASVVVASARPDERAAALELFFHHLNDDDRAGRVERVTQMIADGEMAVDGIFVCRIGDTLAGTMVGVALPGATGMVWPPRALAGAQQAMVEDHLVCHANRWLRERGCKFGQGLLANTETFLGEVLQRCGYAHVTTLLYLRKELDVAESWPTADEPADLVCQEYTLCDREIFHGTLLSSYEDTLDCPELNDARTAEEIIAGYRGVEGCRPERWWLAWHEKRPAGVLILTEHPARASWDLSYLGLVRSARRRGLGQALTRKALRDARMAGATSMTLTMDVRNKPAWRLYRAFNFDIYDQREVYLSVFGTRAPCT